jgi:hypothetical protein
MQQPAVEALTPGKNRVKSHTKALLVLVVVLVLFGTVTCICLYAYRKFTPEEEKEKDKIEDEEYNVENRTKIPNFTLAVNHCVQNYD